MIINSARIQSVGVIDLDVKRDYMDLMLTGSYKWQYGPEGAGIFYVKQEHIDAWDSLARGF